MATSASIALKEPIIPVVSSFDPAYIRTTKVEHEWRTTGNNPRDKHAKMYLPVCDDPANKELFLYVIDAFLDAAHADRLHLTTGLDIYNKFRQVVDGALRIAWVTLSDARNQKSVNSFTTDVLALINKYLSPSSYEDQLNYLRTFEKPFSLDCEALGTRLEVISRLGRLLPGAPTTANNTRQHLYADEAAMKRAYFAMMRGDWKVKFVSSAHDLDDPNFSFQRLVRFMATQETISKQGVKRKGFHHGGGRGGGRYGRGGGGRGYGRGNYGGYSGGGHSNYWGYSSAHGGGRGRGNAGNYQYRSSGYGGRHQQGSFTPGGTPGYAQGYRTPTQGTSTPYGRGRGSSYGRGGSTYGRGSSGRGNTYGRGAARAPFTPGGRQVVYPGVAPTGTRPPSIPNFMTDNYHQEPQDSSASAPVDNYYQEQPVEDQYYDGEPVEQYEEHYYQEEGQPEEHYMADDQGNNGGDTYSEEHYFQDFGF